MRINNPMGIGQECCYKPRKVDSWPRERIMKKLLILTSSLVILSAATLAAVSSQEQEQKEPGIQWLSDVGSALQKAKSENKPILLDFFNPT